MNSNFLLPSTRSRVFPVSAAAVCLLVSGVGFAQTPVRDDPAVRNRDVPVARDVRVVEPVRPLKRGDKDFLEKAAKASMSEVAISRVAAARTSNPEVRRFAQMMVEDHEGAMEHLTSLAAARGVSLPAKDPHPDKWEKRDAKNFDKAYLDQMVDDHESVVKLFEKHAKDGEDADIVGYARKHLPKMQQHLQQAIDLKRALTEKRERR